MWARCGCFGSWIRMVDVGRGRFVFECGLCGSAWEVTGMHEKLVRLLSGDKCI